jgi:hypothetical protein
MNEQRTPGTRAPAARAAAVSLAGRRNVSMKRNCFYYWEELRRIIGGVTPYGDDIRRLTASERRAARIDAAWDAAWAAASQATADWDKRHAIASALLWLEEKGLYGGGFFAPGIGTKRLRFFRSLGKGRRNASDGPAWTEAIGRAAQRHGWCEWALDGEGLLGVHFEPHPNNREAQKEFDLPLREVLFLDGDESADAVEAWLGAAKHAVREFGKPRPYGVGAQTRDLFLAAVQEYTAAKEALARAWELAKPQEAGEAQDS